MQQSGTRHPYRPETKGFKTSLGEHSSWYWKLYYLLLLQSGDPPFSEPRLDNQTWPSFYAFSYPEHLSLIPQIPLGDTDFFASPSSFFGEIQASSSSPNTFDKNTPSRSDGTIFNFSFQSPRVASSSPALDGSQMQGEQQIDTQDLNYDISLEFSSAIPFDGQFSFELDFPLLPSPSDAAGFFAESFAPPSNIALSETEETPPETISQNLTVSLDAEELSGSSPHTSVMSLTSISSTQSTIMPTFVSMESLIHISLDIPDLSSGPSFPSIFSLCQLLPCPSSDDLVRIQLPSWCETEDDVDAFAPLPPDTTSPFCLPSRLGCFKNFMDVEYTCHSLSFLKEED